MKQSQRGNRLSGTLQFWLPRGRMARSLFWVVSLLAVVAFFALFALLESTVGAGTSATLILYPFFYWTVIVAGIRRYHDFGKSGWWLLLLLIPLLGLIWVFIDLGFRKGTIGDNRYGADPTLMPDYMVVG